MTEPEHIHISIDTTETIAHINLVQLDNPVKVIMSECFCSRIAGTSQSDIESIIVAGENLSALKVIYPSTAGKMFYASNDNTSCKSIIGGLNKYAILADGSGSCISYGVVSNNTWAWTLGKPIFLGLVGEMTQTVPTTGFLLVVARPITATKIMVKIEIPINR